jgi:hypothetical protein
MNSLAKMIASISALIASLSFAWVALSITGMIPHRHVAVYHNGGVERVCFLRATRSCIAPGSSGECLLSYRGSEGSVTEYEFPRQG